MAKINLTSTTEVRDQILSLIALEKVVNNKTYTIKTYIEYLVGLAAAGNIDQAGKLKVEVNMWADGPQLVGVTQKLAQLDTLPGISLEDALKGDIRLRSVTPIADASKVTLSRVVPASTIEDATKAAAVVAELVSELTDQVGHEAAAGYVVTVSNSKEEHFARNEYEVNLTPAA